MKLRTTILSACLATLGFIVPLASASAATLPAHPPLRILVVSDEVNPHNLSDAELTQVGELAEALGAPDSGIELDGPVMEIHSQCIDDALTQLSSPNPPDVVIYFAHLSAERCDSTNSQAELTAAFQAHLVAGRGIVVFHHGIYQANGKQEILQLLGGRASSIEWNTQQGQDVIAVAPEHFIASNAISYDGTSPYEDPGLGIPPGDYPVFSNIPDERYPTLQTLQEPGETRTNLFGSQYNGGPHNLGYALTRQNWAGRVVFYQPGEYQPQALDDRDGNNFQILANAILYAASVEPGDGDGDGDGDGRRHCS